LKMNIFLTSRTEQPYYGNQPDQQEATAT